MALNTFANLKTAIADWLNRDDLTSAIPDFITLAEAHMNRVVRHWRMEKRSTATADDQYLALPTDFLEPIALRLTGSGTQPLELTSHQDMMMRRYSAEDTAGTPIFYALTDGQIELYPTPNEDTTVELVYYAKTDALSDGNTSNWILSNHPDAYLYGALVQSAPYLKDDQRAGVWATLFKAALDNMAEESRAAKENGAQLRMKMRKVS